MTSKIFLGNAPWRKPGFYGVRAGSRWPHFETEESEYMPFPFFLAYSSALLKREGFRVKIVDAIAERMTKEDYLECIKTFSPDILVFEVSTISIQNDLEYAINARKLIDDDSAIILCGIHTEMYQSAFLDQHPEIDMVMIGEYETTILDIARQWSSSREFDQIPGILYRDERGTALRTAKRDIIRNIDNLPWPDREDLPMHNYCDTPGNIPRPSVQMWASRGCPYQCVFCAWPQIIYGGSNYRPRNPALVAEEMEWLVKDKGFRSVYFDDDTFNIGKPRILELCQEIIKRDIVVPWAIMARADTMDEEMLVNLKKAGMCALKYGVESAEQSLVDRSGKRLDIEKVKKTVALTKSYGIFIHLTFTFGLPGETLDTIDKTIRLACELNPDSLQFSIITPFPGSKLYLELEKKGHLISKNWEEYDGYNTAVIRTDSLTKYDLEAALQKAKATWEQHRFKTGIKTEPVQVLQRALRNPAGAYKRLKRVLLTMLKS